jgi:hypothetical protein
MSVQQERSNAGVPITVEDEAEEDYGPTLIAKLEVSQKSRKKRKFLKIPILGQRNHSW